MIEKSDHDKCQVKEQINHARDFWSKTLRSARHILAPMVDQSELPFRLMVRRYNVHCTYSPMLHSRLFLEQPKYQQEFLQTGPEFDHPFIIQFCANDPEIFLKAAKIAESHCDAIDLNLGCPQTIAKRGHYGAFLQDEWSLIYDIGTIKYFPIQFFEYNFFKSQFSCSKSNKASDFAGASLITVHGRLREQKGSKTGLADWTKIRLVKENLRIPVFANGNIQSKIEVDKCFDETIVDGVMSAEGLLYNPALFTGKPLAVWDAAYEYVEQYRKHTSSFSSIQEHLELRNVVGKTHSIEDFVKVADQLKKRYHVEYEKFIADDQHTKEHPKNWPVFIFIDNTNESVVEEPVKKKIKKEKKPKGPKPPKILPELCSQCSHPRGLKCDFGYCRICCRQKSYSEKVDCQGHGFRSKLLKSKNDNS
ncbi:tRNA-dihydrouridine(16/17) synthase [NAD(P)(+)]-like protein [Dermatophagoides farinae]|uniref:tRNA-dihydrouridine(16/17) synthase [NAD(P)(+)] n=1 Tax=Dermatophagoides farinae TaxID=6954 RepID=A0A922LD70_DERFA|nr:tRNA-dihydrouridine(16/17) synthase [NAD(P)(+)]-like protein [Dermatophagoides farinae]